jgi:uncharacterized protein YrrD
MHLLRSAAIGTEVIDEQDHQIHGTVTDFVFDPDRGKLVAVLVDSPDSADLLALQTQDIAAWGQRIHIKETDMLGVPDEILRLKPLFEDPRTIIGQYIKTKSGVAIGKCVDIQFDAAHFGIEWIFPRSFLKKGLPLPASDILEITKDAIIVKDQTPKEEKEISWEKPAVSPMESLPQAVPLQRRGPQDPPLRGSF